MEGPLQIPTKLAGSGSLTGKIRGEIWEAKEVAVAKCLERAVGRLPDRTARPVLILPERDKLSAQWVLALPGTDTNMSSAEFAQAMESHLFLPSSAVRHMEVEFAMCLETS